LIKISSENGKGVIIICDYCGQYVCPPPCPDFEGRVAGLGRSVSECSICGQRFYVSDVCFGYKNKPICIECAEELIPSELLEYLDCADLNDFFDMLL